MFSLGFYSVVELVCAMPSIVTVEREETHGDWTLYDARTRQPKPTGKYLVSVGLTFCFSVSAFNLSYKP